jgi:predicted kinase
VGGLLASGKSTVARLIADRISADVLSADEIRGDLFEEGAADAFVPGFSATVYAEVLKRARASLESGRPVVLDGTFRSRGTREAARRLAIDHGVPFLFVECRADPETCRARLRRRERERGQPGWVAMLEAFLELWEPVDELREDEHVVLDTTGPPEALEGRGLDLAERALERER